MVAILAPEGIQVIDVVMIHWAALKHREKAIVCTSVHLGLVGVKQRIQRVVKHVGS